MARKPGLRGTRTVVVATRLTEGEAAWLDASRKSLSRAEYLRLLLVRARKADAETQNGA